MLTEDPTLTYQTISTAKPRELGGWAGPSPQGCTSGAAGQAMPCASSTHLPRSSHLRAWGLKGRMLWTAEKVLPCPPLSHGKWQRGFSGFRVVVWLR